MIDTLKIKAEVKNLTIKEFYRSIQTDKNDKDVKFDFSSLIEDESQREILEWVIDTELIIKHDLFEITIKESWDSPRSEDNDNFAPVAFNFHIETTLSEVFETVFLFAKNQIFKHYIIFYENHIESILRGEGEYIKRGKTKYDIESIALNIKDIVFSFVRTHNVYKNVLATNAIWKKMNLYKNTNNQFFNMLEELYKNVISETQEYWENLNPDKVKIYKYYTEYFEVTDNLVEIDGEVENGVLHTSGTVKDGVLSL
jgi:hypothetical protein